MSKKTSSSALAAIAIIGLGLGATYLYAQQSATDTATAGSAGGGGAGYGGLTPFYQQTTETTQPTGLTPTTLVLPSIPAYEPAPIPAGLFAPPAVPQTTATTTPTVPTSKKEEAVKLSESWAGPLTGITVYGPTGSKTYPVSLQQTTPEQQPSIIDRLSTAVSTLLSQPATFTALALASPMTAPAAVALPFTGALAAPTTKKAAGATTAGGGDTGGGAPGTPAPVGGGGIPAEGIQGFFSAGKDYGTPTGAAPAPGGGTTYYYASGAYQTVRQGQIVSAGSAGALTPPVRYSGQTYAAPGTAAGGTTGRVYSKKAARLAGLI